MKKRGELKRYFLLLLDGVVLKFKFLQHIQEDLMILTTPHLGPFLISIIFKWVVLNFLIFKTMISQVFFLFQIKELNSGNSVRY